MLGSVLAEFYIQNEYILGGFPRLDFFINAKIQQTRLFLKAEHFNSSIRVIIITLLQTIPTEILLLGLELYGISFCKLITTIINIFYRIIFLLI